MKRISLALGLIFTAIWMGLNPKCATAGDNRFVSYEQEFLDTSGTIIRCKQAPGEGTRYYRNHVRVKDEADIRAIEKLRISVMARNQAVRVQQLNPALGGNVRLTAESDPTEPNNTPAQAFPITVEENRRLVNQDGITKIDPSVTGASNPDEDWYSFSAQAGQVFFAYADAKRLGSTLTPTLDLYSFDLVPLKTGIDTNGDLRIAFYTIPATGTYYIKVGGQSGSTGMYRLFVNFLSSKVKFYWIAAFPEGGNMIGDVAFSDHGHCLYATQSINTLQLFSTSGNGTPIYNNTGDTSYYQLAASKNGSICVGFVDYMEYVGSQVNYIEYFDVFTTPQSTPIYHRDNPSRFHCGGLVSYDGSRVVLGQDDGLEIITPTGQPINRFIYDGYPYPFQIYDLSSSATLATVTGYNTCFNLVTGGLRNNSYTYYTGNMSADGKRLVDAGPKYTTGLDWNGSEYTRKWLNVLYMDYGSTIWGVDVSDNGSAIAIGSGTQVPNATEACDVAAILSGETGQKLVSYEFKRDAAIQLDNCIDQIAVNQDGTLAAFGSWGGDRRYPELVVLSPTQSQPVLELSLPGPVKALDIYDEFIAVGIWGEHPNEFIHPNDVSGAVLLIDLGTPPAQVSAPDIHAGNAGLQLNWTNPGDPKMTGVRIQRATGGYPVSPTDGTSVYDGMAQSFEDSGLTNGMKYYYSLFTHDDYGRYSAAVNVSAIPSGAFDPVWVNFAYSGFEDGTQSYPYNTLDEGLGVVSIGGTIKLSGSTSHTDRISKPVRIDSAGGNARIGRN